jgi:hypothetical protein
MPLALLAAAATALVGVVLVAGHVQAGAMQLGTAGEIDCVFQPCLVAASTPGILNRSGGGATGSAETRRAI